MLTPPHRLTRSITEQIVKLSTEEVEAFVKVKILTAVVKKSVPIVECYELMEALLKAVDPSPLLYYYAAIVASYIPIKAINYCTKALKLNPPSDLIKKIINLQNLLTQEEHELISYG